MVMTMSNFISDSDLAYMRDTIADMLPDLCTIYAETISADGQGGVTSSWSATETNIKCRLDDRSGKLSPITAGLKTENQYQLSVPYDTTISTGNLVRVNSINYTVMSINTDQSWIAVKRAVLEISNQAPTGTGL
jgi:hypothetical protein